MSGSVDESGIVFDLNSLGEKGWGAVPVGGLGVPAIWRGGASAGGRQATVGLRAARLGG
jgi:hypothetical protein